MTKGLLIKTSCVAWYVLYSLRASFGVWMLEFELMTTGCTGTSPGLVGVLAIFSKKRVVELCSRLTTAGLTRSYQLDDIGLFLRWLVPMSFIGPS